MGMTVTGLATFMFDTDRANEMCVRLYTSTEGRESLGEWTVERRERAGAAS
jgi:hypothetical protein